MSWYREVEKKKEDPYDILNLLYLKEKQPARYERETNPLLRAILSGVCDEKNLLFRLRGVPHVVRSIWDHLLAMLNRCIKDGQSRMSERDNYVTVAFHRMTIPENRCQITFPPAQDICINMMPFVLGSTFEEAKLPEKLRGYWDNIINAKYHASMRYRGGYCKIISEHELGKIGYLTIHESDVAAGTTQRRPGLHTDCPGKLMVVPDEHGNHVCLGNVDKESGAELSALVDHKFGPGFCTDKQVIAHHPWGMAIKHEECDFVGGIYMATNVADSAQAWNLRIEPDTNGEELIGHLGDIEYLRSILPGEPEVLKPNWMYWMTDRTPHEALPVKEDVYRQYICIITGDVSLWFEEHSTPNPLGVIPDPNLTKIVKYNKFEDNLGLLLGLNPSEEVLDEANHPRWKV